MNKKKMLVEMMDEINSDFLDEYYDRRKVRAQRRKNIFKICNVAACVAIVATISVLAISPMLRNENITDLASSETKESVADTTRQDIPTQPHPTNNNIIYAEDIAGNNGKIDQENIEWGDKAVEKTLYFSSLLKSVLETSDDDEVFAFTVSVINGNPADISLEQTQAVESAYYNYTQVRDACVAEIMGQRGISRVEAMARQYTHPKYISAKDAYMKAEEKYCSDACLSFYNNNKAALDLLSDLGFSLLYDGTNTEYQMYLHAMGAVGVMTATKAQLLEISDVELEYEYCICAASEKADEYLANSYFYIGENTKLSDDSKITDELIELYELNGGEALEVRCIIAYFGKEYIEKWELDQAALAAIGMTEAQFNASSDPEVFEKYRIAKKNIREHTEYNDSVIKDLLDNGYLKESEFIEKEYGEGGFKARLTYERAFELSKNGDIAYIEINNQYVDKDELPVYREDSFIGVLE